MPAQDQWAEHAAFMNGLVDAGLILLGGPTVRTFDERWERTTPRLTDGLGDPRQRGLSPVPTCSHFERESRYKAACDNGYPFRRSFRGHSGRRRQRGTRCVLSVSTSTSPSNRTSVPKCTRRHRSVWEVRSGNGKNTQCDAFPSRGPELCGIIHPPVDYWISGRLSSPD